MVNKHVSRLLVAMLGFGLVSGLSAKSNEVWRDYDNALLGIHMQVKREWTEVTVKETADTGSIAFNIRTTDPVSRVYVMRQIADYPFSVWLSTQVMTQLYLPGYQVSGPVEFAGRQAMKVVGIDARELTRLQEETYYYSRPPYIDQITFSAPKDQWAIAEKDFAEVRKSLAWTR